MNESRAILAQFNALSKSKQREILDLRCPHYHDILSHPQCFKTTVDPHLGEKVGFFDIETTNLTASFGYILTYCIKEKDSDKIIERAISPKDIRTGVFDKNIVRELCEDLRKFTRVITFYGARFDIPFCRTRALKNDLDFPLYHEVLHTDLWFIIRGKLKLHSNRLQAACDFFEIPSKEHRLTPPVWQRANAGDPKAIDFILTHNREDVVSTELLYNKIYKHAKITKRSM